RLEKWRDLDRKRFRRGRLIDLAERLGRVEDERHVSGSKRFLKSWNDLSAGAPSPVRRPGIERDDPRRAPAGRDRRSAQSGRESRKRQLDRSVAAHTEKKRGGALLFGRDRRLGAGVPNRLGQRGNGRPALGDRGSFKEAIAAFDSRVAAQVGEHLLPEPRSRLAIEKAQYGARFPHADQRRRGGSAHGRVTALQRSDECGNGRRRRIAQLTEHRSCLLAGSGRLFLVRQQSGDAIAENGCPGTLRFRGLRRSGPRRRLRPDRPPAVSYTRLHFPRQGVVGEQQLNGSSRGGGIPGAPFGGEKRNRLPESGGISG